MENIKMKATTVDPTGATLDKDEMTLKKISGCPARIIMEIGENTWMFTQDGKTGMRIVPKEN